MAGVGVWIEGIGSLHGLFNPGPPPLTCICSWDLACFQQDGIIKFSNYGNCFPVITDISDYSDHKTDIFPNPTNCSFSIQLPESFGTLEKLEIFNSVGQVVGMFENVDDVDISEYPAGLYYIVVWNEEGERLMSKLIKE